jgi:hypothetical protein
MMTVLWRGRGEGRLMRLSLWAAWPRTWGNASAAPWPSATAPGSAKAGRGGRRQRKRRAAGSRAAETYCENVMTPNVALMNVALDRANRKLPQAFGRHPLVLGYRERRRLAKLRRRRDLAWRRENYQSMMAAWEA